ncbi:hypothetical protein KP509_23G063600 [Ceratopteris richardii]|uniref:Seed maturation protein n=1 Tax=Ceratopteris richardii TaxID=49495 RepID=A0A8T2S383_CERRI|nr:hypothetical protein KP509_23G063600 [Ceratopteris richardii]
MSGAQGAQPKGSHTATTYEIATDRIATEGPPREKPRGGTEDSPAVPVVFEEATAGGDAAGSGGPTFGNRADPRVKDLGVTGTS